jgi:soluble cytochrome b562
MSEKNPENKCIDLFMDAKKVVYVENALDVMMTMQYDLQKFYATKRNSVTPDDPNEKRIKEALYHFNCFIAEIWELQERINMGKPCETDMIEIKFEVIDAWHFLMNMFLYIGIRKFDDILEYYWNYVGSDYETGLMCIAKRWGAILDELPYKYWKTYENYNFNEKRVYKIAEDILCAFITLTKYFSIKKEDFYGMYVAKNKENHDRQIRGY